MQKSATVVNFMKMTCDKRAGDIEKDAICKNFFDHGVQEFKKKNPIAVEDDVMRDYAIEIVYNAIEAFTAHNIKFEDIKSEEHIWRPYVAKSLSVASSDKPSKSSSPIVTKKEKSEASSISGKAAKTSSIAPGKERTEMS